MTSFPVYRGHLSYEENEKRKEENRKKNAADIPELLAPIAARNKVNREEPSNGVFGELYDQDKVTRRQKMREFNLMKSPRRRRARKLLNYDLSESSSESSDSESEKDKAICQDPQNPQNSQNSQKEVNSSVPLSGSPSVPAFNEQFKQVAILQQLELNGLVGYVLLQAQNLDMALRRRETPNGEVLRQNGWTAPKDQLVFIQQVNNFVFASLFDKTVQVPVISQGLEEQNRVMIKLLRDLTQANDRFLSVVHKV